MDVKDVFLKDICGKFWKVGNKIVMLTLGSAKYTNKLNLEFDSSKARLGVYGKFFSTMVNVDVAAQFNINESG